MAEFFIKWILEDDYKEFFTNVVVSFAKYEECMIDDVEEVVKAASIAVLLLGFTKKPINIDEYVVKLKNNRQIKIKTKDFCKEFKNYIDKVENIKFDMLNNII